VKEVIPFLMLLEVDIDDLQEFLQAVQLHKDEASEQQEGILRHHRD
jgi:hypothetical protein